METKTILRFFFFAMTLAVLFIKHISLHINSMCLHKTASCTWSWWELLDPWRAFSTRGHFTERFHFQQYNLYLFLAAVAFLILGNTLAHFPARLWMERLIWLNVNMAYQPWNYSIIISRLDYSDENTNVKRTNYAWWTRFWLVLCHHHDVARQPVVAKLS